MNNKLLFTLTLFITLVTYIYLLGEVRTIQIIVNEMIFVLSLFPLLIIYFYYKLKLRGYDVEHLINKRQLSFKMTVLLFLVIEVFDYFYEGGFTGMISQWFLYWILGLLSLLLIDTIHFYRISKLIR